MWAGDGGMWRAWTATLMMGKLAGCITGLRRRTDLASATAATAAAVSSANQKHRGWTSKPHSNAASRVYCLQLGTSGAGTMCWSVTAQTIGLREPWQCAFGGTAGAGDAATVMRGRGAMLCPVVVSWQPRPGQRMTRRLSPVAAVFTNNRAWVREYIATAAARRPRDEQDILHAHEITTPFYTPALDRRTT